MKKVFMAGALLGALFLHSCEDNDFRGNGDDAGVPMEPGTTIDFGAGLSTQAGSRTVYGDETTDGSAVKVHWKYSEETDEEKRKAGLDKIFIFSPHSDADNDRGVYMVNPDMDKSTNYAPVIAEDETKQLVAKKATHDFYAVYPASAILQEPEVGKSDEVWIYGMLSAHQEVTVDPSKITDNVMEAEYDMDLNFMKAVHPNYALKAGQPVRLQFEPWATVLDITIPGPAAADGTTDYCDVTQVLVRTRQADKTGEGADIAGTFKCNLKTNELEFTRMPDETSTVDESNHIINIDIVQPDGTRGVRLGIGQSLNLKAFLLPVAQVENVEVEVYSADNKMWGVFLRKGQGSTSLLEPGQIHRVTLPNITLPGKASYSSWMTNLPDNMLIANMSIPGSYMSFSDGLTGDDQLQSCDIADQFNAGIRAFHTQIRFTRDDDDPAMPGVATLDPQGYNCYLSTTNDGTTDCISLGQAIHELHQEMQSRGNREFCVLFLKLSANFNTLPRMLECLKKYADRMCDLQLVDREMPERFTLGNFRGKILLQVLIPADPDKLESRQYNWNYSQAQSPTKAATLSPGSSIERWLTHQTTYVGGWASGSPFYSTGGLSSWKPIDGAPVLLSWETTSHDSSWGLTPVTYGRIGEWSYTPRYTTQAAFNAAKSDYATNGYDSYVYENWTLAPTLPNPLTEQDKIGLATMNASVIMKNTNLLGTDGGMSYNSVYRAELDIDPTKLANGEYALFGGNGNYTSSIYWWLHGESPFNGGTTQNAYEIMRSMWDTNTGAVRTWRDRLGQNLFVTTVLGVNSFDGSFAAITPKCKAAASHVLLTNWANNVFNKSVVGGTGSTYFDISGINEYLKTPLGIVLMPYIASPENQITIPRRGGDGTDKDYATSAWITQNVPSDWTVNNLAKIKTMGMYNTSQMIGAIIGHNNSYLPENTNGN